jgi:hypothetical protein
VRAQQNRDAPTPAATAPAPPSERQTDKTPEIAAAPPTPSIVALESAPTVDTTDTVARPPAPKTRSTARSKRAKSNRVVDPMHPPKFEE